MQETERKSMIKGGLALDYRTLINRPRTKRGLETLNNILSAAAQEIYEKGYYNTSINDITKRAGVGAGTFYTYFESKYNLYKFLLLQCSHMIRKHLSRSIRNCKTRREAEEVGLRAWLQFVRENRYMYHVIWESMYIDKALFVDYYVSFAKAYMRGIDAAKETGEVRSEIDSEVLAYTLMGASNFLGLNWGLFKDYPIDVEKVVESFMYIIDGGIFNEKRLPPPPPEEPQLPIRITVDFDDVELEDEPEGNGGSDEDAP